MPGITLGARTEFNSVDEGQLAVSEAIKDNSLYQDLGDHLDALTSRMTPKGEKKARIKGKGQPSKGMLHWEFNKGDSTIGCMYAFRPDSDLTIGKFLILLQCVMKTYIIYNTLHSYILSIIYVGASCML